MKLDKYQICTIIGLVILIITAIVTNINMERDKSLIRISYDSIPTTIDKDLPNNIGEIAKKYRAFEDIYNSDKKVLTYGYDSLTVERNKGTKFHKKLSKKLTSSDNYQYIPYKDGLETIEILEEKYGTEKDTSNEKSCTMPVQYPDDLKSLLDTTRDCLESVCIIDKKNNKYTVISRDIDFIVDTVEKTLYPN